mgnify:CR=1 FL=1
MRITCIKTSLKAGFFVREPNPAYEIHGKKGSFLKHRGDLQEDALKLGEKPNLTTWKSENEGNEGILHAEMNGTVIYKKIPTLLGNYYDYFDGVYQSIVNGKPEPVTAQDGVNVMRIIDAAIQSNTQKKVVNL